MVKNPPANARDTGDVGFIPGWGRYSEVRNGKGGGWGASPVAQRLKCLPPMWETQVRSLGREDPLEKEMVTHSSILAWRIP